MIDAVTVAKNGHNATIKLLLETVEIDVDLKDNYRDEHTPLLWAA